MASRFPTVSEEGIILINMAAIQTTQKCLYAKEGALLPQEYITSSS